MKCCRGVSRSYGKQLLINLVGEIRASGRRGNEPAFAVDTDRNHDTAAGFLAPANVTHDFLPRNLAEHSDVLLQPLRKCLPRIPPRHLDHPTACGIAQTHKSEIQLERFDQQIGEIGGNGGPFSSHPLFLDPSYLPERPYPSAPS